MRRTVIPLFFLFLAYALSAQEGATNSPPSSDNTGTIRFEKSGGEGDYSVYLDGTLAGDNLTEITAVSPGVHKVEIRQQRLLRESVLFLEDLNVPSGGEVVASFQMPEELKSEARAIALLKLNVRQALANNDSLFDLRTELNDMLLKMPDWMKEKPVLKDYSLKVDMELTKREEVMNFIYGDPVDVSYFLKDFDFLSYKSDTTTASEDFTRAVEYILVLKRLEMIRSLESGDYETFAKQRDAVSQYGNLTASQSAEFEQKYAADFNLMNGFYHRFVESRRRPDTKHLRKYMELYYGRIWETLSQVREGDFILDSREVLALKADYMSMKTAPPWDPKKILTLKDPVRLYMTVGGGSLATVGMHWEPGRWFALDSGISGAFDFFNRSSSDLLVTDNSPFVTVTIPLEADFFIINRKMQLFLGLTTDFLRFQDRPSVHWSNSWAHDSSGNQTGSRFAFLTSAGFNLGIGLKLGSVDLYMDNYLQFPYLISPDFNLHSFRYSPALGVRL